MPSKPLLLLDVDGVISLFGFPAAAPPAGRWVLVDGIPHLLSAAAPVHLAALAEDFELVWCSGWEDRANEYLPQALGLPGPLPYLRFDPPAARADHFKLGAIEAHGGPDRPLAWIDDAHTAVCARWAAERPGRTLLVGTDPAIGLTGDHVDRLRAWAQTAQDAVTEWIGGSSEASVRQLAPASAEPNSSPVVEPK